MEILYLQIQTAYREVLIKYKAILKFALYEKQTC